jgi:hypothetical protein
MLWNLSEEMPNLFVDSSLKIFFLGALKLSHEHRIHMRSSHAELMIHAIQGDRDI